MDTRTRYEALCNTTGIHLSYTLTVDSPDRLYAAWYYVTRQVKPDIDRVVEALRAKGVSKLAIVGFCWGGKMSTLAVRTHS